MKKKLYIVLLSVSLVLALASAGVCFADSFDLISYQYVTNGASFSNGVLNTTGSGGRIGFNVSSLVNGETYYLRGDITLTNPPTNYSSFSIFRGTQGASNSNNGYLGNSSDSVITVPNAAGLIPIDIEFVYNSSYPWINFVSNVYYGSLDLSGLTVSDGNTLIGEVVDFSLSPGYALVIDGPCEIVERSYYINNSWDFTKNGNMRVNGAFENDLSATYIREGYSPDLAYSRDDLIQWEALNANIVGAASNYESYNGTLVQITDGETYVIGYPKLYGFGTSNSRLLYTNSVDLVGHVYINYLERPTFRYVAIESLSEFSNTGDFYTYSVFRPAVADVEGDVSEGGGGVVITPSDPLPSGGGNAGQPPVDEDGSLLGTISRFVNDIKRLLSSAVEAINTLVNDGSSFMQSIGAMFTWLPAPIYGLLISAFTVLVVVGVLKTLWR